MWPLPGARLCLGSARWLAARSQVADRSRGAPPLRLAATCPGGSARDRRALATLGARRSPLRWSCSSAKLFRPSADKRSRRQSQSRSRACWRGPAQPQGACAPAASRPSHATCQAWGDAELRMGQPQRGLAPELAPDSEIAHTARANICESSKHATEQSRAATPPSSEGTQPLSRPPKRPPHTPNNGSCCHVSALLSG